MGDVPLYEYRCRTCDATFEMRRAMAQSDDPTHCPEGHADTVRRLSVFAATGAAAAPATPCGSACACAPR